MGNKTLSIIIVNYRSEQYLKNCLASLFRHLQGADFEIIVVNNDESESLDNLNSQFPGIKIINHQKNIGFGAACNMGAKDAQGGILWFLNPDTEIISENIGGVIGEFNKDPAVGIVGLKVVDGENNVQEWSAGNEMVFLGILLNNLGYKRDKKIWESADPVECGWVTGGAMFVGKELFEKLGGFDDKLFLYFEDIDLCKRTREEGKNVLYFPEFVIKHFGGGSMLDKKKQKKDYYQSQDYYFQKHLGKRQAGILKFLKGIFSKDA